MIPEIQLIWEDLSQELGAFIYDKVKDKEASKDLLQDVFLKVHAKIHQLKDCKKLTSWVYQITRNVINDYFRSQKRLAEVEMVELPLGEKEEPSFQQLSACINSKINQLPAAYREALVLTTFQELKQTELAAYLGISYSGAKSRVQRAKEKLTDLVADCEQVETDNQGKIVEHELDE